MRSKEKNRHKNNPVENKGRKEIEREIKKKVPLYLDDLSFFITIYRYI